MSLPALLLALAAPAQDAAAPSPPPAAISAPASGAEQLGETAAAKAHRHAPGDPLEGFNRRLFAAHQAFDRKFFRPAALGYKHAVPNQLRVAIRNFFSNLGEPIVFLNDLLQLKPGRAIRTFGRFAFNSTLGIGGIVDVAKLPGLKLPHRPNGLGDTLGYYGVKPGPYLFLPFIGPTDLRDLLGGQGDGLVLPLAVGAPFDRFDYQVTKGALTGLDTRAEADGDLQALFAGAVDPYATLRSVYLQDRAGEIAELKSKRAASSPAPELGEPLEDPAGTATPPDSTAPELSDPLTDPAALAPTAP